MTSRDAVNLLLATTLAENPSRYVAATSAAAGLAWSSGDNPPVGAPDVIVAATSAETLGEALAGLVDHADGLAPPRPRSEAFRDAATDQRRNVGPALLVKILRQRGGILARLQLDWRDNDGPHRLTTSYGGPTPMPAGVGTWSTTYFDQAIFIALKRTVAAAPPWAFAE
jgi:hypothetical protein